MPESFAATIIGDINQRGARDDAPAVQLQLGVELLWTAVPNGIKRKWLPGFCRAEVVKPLTCSFSASATTDMVAINPKQTHQQGEVETEQFGSAAVPRQLLRGAEASQT